MSRSAALLPHRSSRRIAALDAARALGVVAMVFGHTLDAVLAPAAREAPLLVAYWKARGLTAPLFLAAAGWAVTVAIRGSGARGLAIARGRLPRVLLLLAIGYALRWPGWGVAQLRAGDLSTWAHFLAFDALHAIAISVLAAALVLGLPWTAREKGLLFAFLVVLSVALGMAAPAPLLQDPYRLPAAPAALALAQAAGGTSPFPVFPWAGYFFAGAIVGLAAPGSPVRRALVLAAAGGALVLGTCWTGVGMMPTGHPILFAYRTGVVLLVLAALCALPAAAAARLAPVGRASLGVYALHVPLVYGWSTHEGLWTRVGQALPLGRALAVAALVLAASLAASWALQPLLAALRAAAPVARERAFALLAAVAGPPRGAGEG